MISRSLQWESFSCYCCCWSQSIFDLCDHHHPVYSKNILSFLLCSMSLDLLCVFIVWQSILIVRTRTGRPKKRTQTIAHIFHHLPIFHLLICCCYLSLSLSRVVFSVAIYLYLHYWLYVYSLTNKHTERWHSEAGEHISYENMLLFIYFYIIT